MAIRISQRAMKDFQSGFSGEIILPEHPGYDESRKIFNAMINKRPGIIAQCAKVEDVKRAVSFGREFNLEIAVRGGGHSVAGKGLTEGGLMIDLRRMNAVTVDPGAKTVTAEGGATMGHLDRATAQHGLATTGGRVSTTGVGGYALGGGDGWLARKMGLACDNLVSVTLVTAESQVIRANEKENPELFWALHGGGGNFGVATSLTFNLHELSVVTVWLLLWRPEAGPDVIRAYRNYMASAPDEVGGGSVYLTAPEEAFVPEHLIGKLALGVLIIYAGPEEKAREAVAPILSLEHEGQFMEEMQYAEMQHMLDDPPGYRNYWSAEYLDAFPDEAVDLYCARAYEMLVPSPSQQVLIPQRGAIARGPAHYPIPWRHASWCVHPLGMWENSVEDNHGRQWVKNIREDLKPWVSGATYLNFIGEEGADRLVAGFGRENLAKLSKIKSQYDPDNIFHLNHNIMPADGDSV